MALNLEKKQELVRLTLEKRQVPTNIVMAVKLMMDVSGSTQPMFSDGTVQELVDRLIPVAMRFDDNQSLEAYAFGSDVQQVKDIKPDDFGNYTEKFIRQVKKEVLWSGTKYGKALSRLVDDINPAKSGFINNLLGRKQAVKPPPSFVMFVTDGDTQGDETEAEKQIKHLRELNCYIMLVGVGPMSFNFLKRLAAAYDHVGFVSFRNLGTTSDEDMYNALLGEELCTWIKKQ